MRIGRFTVPAQWAREFSTGLKRVMGQCIVVRAEMLFARDAIEYMAISEHFQEVPLGGEAPEYKWTFSETDGLSAVEVKPNAVVSGAGTVSLGALAGSSAGAVRVAAFGAGPFHVEQRTNAHAEICNAAGRAVAQCSWSADAEKRATALCDLLNIALGHEPNAN